MSRKLSAESRLFVNSLPGTNGKRKGYHFKELPGIEIMNRMSPERRQNLRLRALKGLEQGMSFTLDQIKDIFRLNDEELQKFLNDPEHYWKPMELPRGTTVDLPTMVAYKYVGKKQN